MIISILSLIFSIFTFLALVGSIFLLGGKIDRLVSTLKSIENILKKIELWKN